MTDDDCPELFYQRKQTKLQWLQNPKQMDGHNVNSVRSESSRHLRNK